MSSLNPRGPKISSGRGAGRPSLLWSSLSEGATSSRSQVFNIVFQCPSPLLPLPPFQPPLNPAQRVPLTSHYTHTPHPGRQVREKGIVGKVPWGSHLPVERCVSNGEENFATPGWVVSVCVRLCIFFIINFIMTMIIFFCFLFFFVCYTL